MNVNISSKENLIPVIIPSYEPDERMTVLVKELAESGEYIVIVDDGSGEEFKVFFDKAKELLAENGVILRHDVNKGKGAALKTAFKYVLDNMTEAVGTVTADSDGQHCVASINDVKKSLLENKDSLILGVRSLEGDDIPWKSKAGNAITKKVTRYVSGLDVSDTQTGLRGIPAKFMEELLSVKGDRFEFEMRMLLEAKGKYKIIEVPISTIYESKDHHSTHFNPFADSIRIYRVLGESFIRYIFSSLSSCVLDIALFSFLCFLLKGKYAGYIAIATVIARIVSATYNFALNYKMVFKSNEKVGKAAIKYVTLAVVQMALSAFLVTMGVKWLVVVPETVVKIVVDTCLFFMSYKIQQKFVYISRKPFMMSSGS
ncbi:bifunctional glycosyltransferase family 2/GtrA family protein [Butyrivibrio sp. INlla21]|uniref:bifunctional glycosyltransferase family 2/GtrA family protein n=1 Tax=Butyrivibrio sp. INlla21 TaxID=1520811 RepID=UPI0008EA777D|nr:bifunctional glycosyltransferase family 2/GtrA family protein [Butyrivibrio sp. INlla21]SFU54023.1 Glycosyltransferase involved in cell wall bisynthesis [Butyrivibrio sp. INlla21]